MNLVKEHINFERGLDPKDAMQLGNFHERQIQKTLQDLAEEYVGTVSKIKTYKNGNIVGTLFINNFRFIMKYQAKENRDFDENFEYRVSIDKLNDASWGIAQANLHTPIECKQQIEWWIFKYFKKK